ncbi:transaldolase [Crassisporium funariophilum]|nr:transaldolase [Crassisporium funariophilum]
MSHTFTALDSLRESGITVASDGADYNKIGEFDPTDATTNPSLVLAAISTPEYSHLLDEAVRHAQSHLPTSSIDERIQLALDRLLVQVAVQILKIIPGRVSVSVDPRLGYNCEAIINKGHALITLFEEINIPRSRILIKIPATAPGIRAAHTLETEGIHTNMTLIFSLVQALACAQAGVAVISPFIGRVKDWWNARAVKDGELQGLDNQPLSEHPGIQLVHRIRAAFVAYGYSTQIMAAGFRKPDEIVELSKAGTKGGADLVTLPPDLLDGLRQMVGQRNPTSEFRMEVIKLGPEPLYFSCDGPTAAGQDAFERDSAAEMISLDKVPEGLAKFSADATILEEKVRAQIERVTTCSDIWIS